MNISDDIPEFALQHPPLSLEMVGGVRLCCPDDLRLMTPYVISEQGDWFEDEIKFLRALLGPDDRVVDIGANYGVYALTAASICSRGAVWAYEPCAATAAHLRASAEHNGFGHLRVIQAALSDHGGSGHLATNANAELNSISADAAAVGEPVRLVALDEQMAMFGEGEIDFLKIDAEGHEPEVLRGGAKFLEARSPLVMIEVKAGAVVSLGPLGTLRDHGYAAYRLVPGLNALVPFRDGEHIDGYLLNLFCCKPDRAGRLHALERLVLDSADGDDAEFAGADGSTWRTLLARYPYGEQLESHWLQQVAANSLSGWQGYETALDAWARAQSADIAIGRRWQLLRMAFGALSSVVGEFATVPRLMSLVRVAADCGARDVAVAALDQLVVYLRDNEHPFLGEPFLTPSREFELVPPGENPVAWAAAAVLDGYERLRAFSSYFSPQTTVQVADEMTRLGYPSAAVERRSELARVLLA